MLEKKYGNMEIDGHRKGWYNIRTKEDDIFWYKNIFLAITMWIIPIFLGVGFYYYVKKLFEKQNCNLNDVLKEKGSDNVENTKQWDERVEILFSGALV